MRIELRFLALIVLAIVNLGSSARAASVGDPIRVGVVVDGPWSGNETVRQLTIDELNKLTEGEFEVAFPDDRNLIGDWSLAAARDNLELLLEDPNVDVIVTWGLLASHAVCCLAELPKPVVAPVVIDRELQGFPLLDGASGVTNLSYVSLPNTLVDDLVFFRRMVPFQNIAILVNAALLEAIPELPSRTTEKLHKLGPTDLEFEYIPIATPLGDSLASISPRADAVYVWPLFHLSPAEHQLLIDELNARRLPTFSALGGTDLASGMLASLGTPGFLERLARRAALNIQRTLLGEDSASFQVEFLLRDRLQINMATAHEIGVSPSSFLLLEADVINRDVIAGRETRTLREAVHEAIQSNLSLAVEQRDVDAGAQMVDESRSAFRPHLGSSITSIQIDPDRAAASFGSQAERTASAGISLEQLIYSNQAATSLAIERHLQTARESSFEAKRLDIALAAAVAYLDVLRAKSLVQVQRNNLELTRSNLELARIRRSVGSASASEVHRWESQIATDRKELIDSMSDQQVAEIALNRVMHRPLGSRFLTEEVGVTDPGLMTGHVRFHGYIETPRRYGLFTEFMVSNGLDASPEIAAVESRIAAQLKALEATKKAYWAPTVGFSATYEDHFDRSGEGSQPLELPGTDLSTRKDGQDWSIAFRASLPLFEGGARTAKRLRAEIELESSELQLASLSEQIEQRIRSSMAAGWASFPGIELARAAADAAAKNLELVADAYRRGAVSIVDLLDAQNVALNAGQLATNSVHDFLVDLMEAERANGHFQVLMNSSESTAWFDLLEAYFTDRGVTVELRSLPLNPAALAN